MTERKTGKDERERESKETEVGRHTWEKEAGHRQQYVEQAGEKTLGCGGRKRRETRRINCTEGHLISNSINKNTASINAI